MLAMSKGALTAAQAETYYEEKYSRDDYYTEEQRVAGQWYGRGANELGLSGEVVPEDFRAVLRGVDPTLLARVCQVLLPRKLSRIARGSRRIIAMNRALKQSGLACGTIRY
jgi:hypothetical protein